MTNKSEHFVLATAIDTLLFADDQAIFQTEKEISDNYILITHNLQGFLIARIYREDKMMALQGANSIQAEIIEFLGFVVLDMSSYH